MEVAGSSEMSVNINHTTRRHIAEFFSYHRESFNDQINSLTQQMNNRTNSTLQVKLQFTFTDIFL